MVVLRTMDLSILIGLASFKIASLRFLRMKLILYKKNILAVIRKQSTELDWENFITVIANFAQSTTGAKYIWQTEYYWLISEYLGQN